MIDAMPNAGASPIIGWAYDGYPIYGMENPDGSEIAEGTLGPCNGASDSNYGYRYHTSQSAPYIIKCLKGLVDETILPRVSTSRPGGTPIEVESLVHTEGENDDGTLTRRLSYTYQDLDYYIQYMTREDSSRCFDVTARMCNASSGPGGGACSPIEQDDCYCREIPSGESAPADCVSQGAPPGA